MGMSDRVALIVGVPSFDSAESGSRHWVRKIFRSGSRCLLR